MATPYTLTCTAPLAPQTLEKVKAAFKVVNYHPDGNVPEAALKAAEVFFCEGPGLPPALRDVKTELPAVKLVQLSAAGADKILAGEAMKAYAEGTDRSVTLCTASGLHVLSIPNYVVASIINANHQIPTQITWGRTQRRWASGSDIEQTSGAYYTRRMHGRTVGLLGYGSLGRETARLLKAHGMHVIAANTSGGPTPQTGFIVEGTGDADGSIPEAYYSTKDRASFEEFLKKSEVLVCSLPKTAQTAYILGEKELALLPKNAVLINVGRGNLVKTQVLIDALDRPEGLFAAAVDVTDPEPLPQDDPLWSHPKCVITPHLSGDAEDELDVAADVLITNVRNLEAGRQLVNVVDYQKGY
ncbi:hypothetical protein IAT38_003010 [Cryptococcus sp. DSM 104549]